MKQDYLTIEIKGEKNIGFIDMGGISFYEGAHGDKYQRKITQVLEPKLVKALTEHFDCPVKIRLTEVKSTKPIKVTVTVVIEADSEDYTALVNLNETWVY